MTTLTSVRELIVTANQEALNAAITEHQIEPEKIISVIWLPGKHLAIGDYEPKYRILYRA
jgi:hypothetical protein